MALQSMLHHAVTHLVSMRSGSASFATVFLVSVLGVGVHSPRGPRVVGSVGGVPIVGKSPAGIAGVADLDGTYHPVPADGIVGFLDLKFVGVPPTGHTVGLQASCGC